MSLMKVIAAYDAEQEAHIKELEAEIKDLRSQLAEMSTLMMQRDTMADRYKLQAIMAGAFDNLRPQGTEEKVDG